MITHIAIALPGLLVVSLRPRAWSSAVAASILAAVGIGVDGLGVLGAALAAAAPMVAVLAAGICVASAVVRAGGAHLAAAGLAACSRGSARRLYWLVCGLTVLLTEAVTLDGAVVLLAPVVLELRSRFGAPLRPLLLGVVAAANASSFAVPLGNPTNVVVMRRLGMPLFGTVERTVGPALAAALLCVGVLAWSERGSLRRPLRRTPYGGRRTSAGPAGGAAGVARATVQVVSLLALCLPLSGRMRVPVTAGLAGLVVVAIATAALAAAANNLPASALVAAGLAPGPAAPAALVGLSVGALATTHGSVATMIAGELTGDRPHVRALAPAAAAATALAAVLVWLT